MSVKVYVPCDSSALALGADKVAKAIEEMAAERKMNIELVRNGSRGLYWLEPLVEVEVEGVRQGYGPVSTRDVADLFRANFLDGGEHPLNLGPVDDIPYLKNQQRLVFRRMGLIDPLSIDSYQQLSGFSGLKKALSVDPAAVIEQIKTSGLRGRGGAGFPTFIKLQTVADTGADQKYIVCNADEGDSGTFSDRMIMEGDPFTLIEGMAIAGVTVGATRGYIYLRSEYPHAHKTLNRAIDIAKDKGYLGDNLLGSDHGFHLEVRLGAGAYVCGEETSLLESLEGKRGQVRAKPPLPAIEGLFGKPTVVNNVITLASLPIIVAEGGAAFAQYGFERSLGPLPFQLAGNIKHPGLVEVGCGITLRELLYDYGGGTASGRPIKAVQVGGPLGAYIPESQFDTPMDYEAFLALGGTMGHGGLVVFDEEADMVELARFAMEFCAVESCGKCTPCRIGSTRGVEVIDRIRAGKHREQNMELLLDLCDTLEKASLCALGGLIPSPVRSSLKHFAEEWTYV